MDLVKLRAETVGSQARAHFNNAGSALPPTAVVQAQHAYLDLEAKLGGYEAVEQQQMALERPYAALAQMLSCEPDEIAIVTSATTAWQQVFFGLPFQRGDRILTSRAEYGSNYLAYIQVGNEEASRGGALESLIKERPQKPVLIAVTHVPTSSGRVYSAEAVGRVAQREGITYLLDACQSIGQMPLDVRALGCDYLTGTGRKYLRGPRGSGFLYASRKAMAKHEPAALDIHGATWTGEQDYKLDPTAKRYEVYEMSMAAKVGLGVAVEYALNLGMPHIWDRVCSLATLMRQKLEELPGLELHDKGRQLCGIISFSLKSHSPAEVKAALASKGINISVSAAPSTLLDFRTLLPTPALAASSRATWPPAHGSTRVQSFSRLETSAAPACSWTVASRLSMERATASSRAVPASGKQSSAWTAQRCPLKDTCQTVFTKKPANIRG
ncbi:hypothetical protein WJX84_007776 [Apatococcus fuscideae]|uniref:Aminotransferase class V domain-containing protein n=1 Tax=Apatococcus fuscideae TaxID=2026836 RepID=A0AAW1SXH0_9CHLO